MKILFNRFPVLLGMILVSGTIIGAGVFVLPYIANLSGIWLFIFWLVIISAFLILTHLIFGEISLRTSTRHYLPGYAQIYLGRSYKWIFILSTIPLFVFSLLIYLLLGGQFLNNIFSTIGINGNIGYFIFWALGCFFILANLRTAMSVDFYISLALVFLIVAISIIGLNYFNTQNINFSFNASNFFLPYGAIFYALSGLAIVPELKELLGRMGQTKSLKPSIIWGIVLPVVLYLVFVFAVLGVAGNQVSPEAISSLKSTVGDYIVFIGSIFGFLAVFTSFIIFGLYLKDSLRFDFSVPWPIAVAFTIFVPALLFLFGAKSLPVLISLIGAVSGGLESIFLLLIHKKAQEKGQRTPEYSIKIKLWGYLAITTVLILAAVWQIIYIKAL